MSAQDDVLAAFGELPWKVREAKADAESGEAGDGEVEAGSAEAEAGDAAGAADAADAAGEEPKAGPADAATGEEPAPAGPVGAERAETGEKAPASDSTEVDVGQTERAESGEKAPAGSNTGVGDESELGHGSAPEGQASKPGESSGEQAPEPVAAQPYLDPAAFFAELQAETAPPPKPGGRRRLVRYAAAVVLAGAVGAGTAYAVSLPRRTDLPFLATPSDGRYTFPSAVRPAPPSGEPVPNDGSNTGQVHYGDLRQYLLPAPTGAVPKEDGWESVADFESSLSGTDVSGRLFDAGLRHVAWRGWSAADGQHTVIELLQFPDREAAFGVVDALDGASLAKAGAAESVVPVVTVRPFGDITRTVAVHKFDQVTNLPGQVERRVVFASGDVIAIVTTTAPAKVTDLPTEQVAMLQAEMLR